MRIFYKSILQNYTKRQCGGVGSVILSMLPIEYIILRALSKSVLLFDHFCEGMWEESVCVDMDVPDEQNSYSGWEDVMYSIA